MNAVQPMTQKAPGSSLVDPLGQPSQIAQVFPDSGRVVIDSDRTSVGSITDQDLARAAFSQAVALYDSCVQYAVATQLASRRPRKAMLAKSR